MNMPKPITVILSRAAQAGEEVFVQALVPQAAVEALHVAVLDRLARAM